MIKKNQYKNAFTLIEILFSIMILTLIILGGAIVYFNFQRYSNITAATANVINILKETQNNARNNSLTQDVFSNSNYPVGVGSKFYFLIDFGEYPSNYNKREVYHINESLISPAYNVENNVALANLPFIINYATKTDASNIYPYTASVKRCRYVIIEYGTGRIRLSENGQNFIQIFDNSKLMDATRCYVDVFIKDDSNNIQTIFIDSISDTYGYY